MELTDLPFTDLDDTDLATFLEDQRRFMHVLGISESEGEYLTDPYFEAAVDGIVTESAEVLDALSVLSKPWKHRPLEETREKVLEEMVDVLFMLLEGFVLAKLSAKDVRDLYNQKLAQNLRRLPENWTPRWSASPPEKKMPTLIELADLSRRLEISELPRLPELPLTPSEFEEEFEKVGRFLDKLKKVDDQQQTSISTSSDDQ